MFASSTRTRSDRAKKVLGYEGMAPELWACLEEDLLAVWEGKR